MFAKLIKNDVFANLAFVLVLFIGFLSYMAMPRQQDPEVNFNWIQIITAMPGASAEDIERRITNPLEDTIQNISDIRFAISVSRDNVSSILIRFNELTSRDFDKRIADLRREIQNTESQLPDAAEQPFVYEVTSSNSFSTAVILVTGPAFDENLRYYAKRISKELTNLREVDRVETSGFTEPELHVNFSPAQITALNLNPTDISNAISASFRDSSAGNIDIGNQAWLVRLVGIFNDPQILGNTLIKTPEGDVPLNAIADVTRGREEAKELISYRGKPAIMLSITKSPKTNTLEMVERIKHYIDERNTLSNEIGAKIVLMDDQTQVTRDALRMMQSNMLLGFLMVLLVTWLFLGFKIATLTSIAIPFILAGVFWVLNIQGETLNVMVLLGVIISLGMLVDDAVVVVESIYYRLERGATPIQATIDGLKEVIAPVTASVLTTIAAFLPLMLLPGIIGQFLQVVPIVVSIALLISLVEAYWMLPAHIVGFKIRLNNQGRLQQKRQQFIRKLRLNYGRLLAKALRHPLRILYVSLSAFLCAAVFIVSGAVKNDFFASEEEKLFYVNVEMPAGTPLEKTLQTMQEIEQKVRKHINLDDVRSIVSIAGQQLTGTSPLYGNVFGQIMISLLPNAENIDDIIQSMQDEVTGTLGPVNITFLRTSDGPPTTAPVELKIQGHNFDEIRRAAADMMAHMSEIPGLRDIKSDDSAGQKELLLRLNQDAIVKAGLSTETVQRTLRLMVDGELVAAFQDKGEEVRLRVKSKSIELYSIDDVLRQNLVTPSGIQIPLSELLEAEYKEGPIQIRHYNYLRTITITADIDTTITDTRKANDDVMQLWQQKAAKYPNISIDNSGLLDDLNESLSNMITLFLFGILLMYLIIATQFQSYFQPVIILFTVSLAFIGVVFGLTLSRIPFSLYTMYGSVALAGIAVNSAIVLISAANSRRNSGMSPLHAILYAGRRRVVPVIMTSLTTVAGLLSLALGIGGKSAIWGPIATVLVWGLIFSTILTLFVIPNLYLGFECLTAKFQRFRLPNSKPSPISR